MPKEKVRPPFKRSPDGFMEERSTIVVAHYWPDEGYGVGRNFKSRDAALQYARTEAADVERGDVRAEIHIVETDVRTTVVRARQ